MDETLQPDPTTEENSNMDALVQSIVIDAPIQRVWGEITKLGQVSRALMDSVFDTTLEPGAPVLYRSEDGKRVFIVGRIIEVEAPHVLKLRWQLTMRNDPPSVVTWQLNSESAGRTRVTVTHGEFAEGTKLKGYSKTWASMLSNLKQVIEHGELRLGTRLQYAVMRRMQFAMPSSTKRDNVVIPD